MLMVYLRPTDIVILYNVNIDITEKSSISVQESQKNKMAEERRRHQKYGFVKKNVRKERLLYNIQD